MKLALFLLFIAGNCSSELLEIELDKVLDQYSGSGRLKRSPDCPPAGDSSGRFGINSFNFLTFILLTFNLVVSINNNINNNNNNNNDNSLNAVSQTSNNVATNTNSVNQLSVTILPIPGKRSFENLRQCRRKREANDVNQRIASTLFKHIADLNTTRTDCVEYNICLKIAQILHEFGLESNVTGCSSDC